MDRFGIGDKVRVDIPNRQDPDFDRFHGMVGEIADVIQDDAGTESGDERDDTIYRVQFTDGETMDFRWRDLRPSPTD